MSDEIFITLKSMEHREDDGRWLVSFSARSSFIGRVTLNVSVEDSDPNPRGEDMPRAPEDILARARRRLAVGLGKLAMASLTAVEPEFRNAITAEVQSSEAAGANALHHDSASEASPE